MFPKMTPQYSTVLFTEVWDTASKFITDFEASPFSAALKNENAIKVYYLLYAKYGNNPIANRDVEQFKQKIFAIIFQYGANWQRKLEIQERLRSLSEDEIQLSSKTISNHAMNPSSDPSTGALEELLYVDDQQASIAKKGKLDGYFMLWSLLDQDITEQFIAKFQECFKQFVQPEKPLLYYEEDN